MYDLFAGYDLKCIIETMKKDGWIDSVRTEGDDTVIAFDDLHLRELFIDTLNTRFPGARLNRVSDEDGGVLSFRSDVLSFDEQKSNAIKEFQADNHLLSYIARRFTIIGLGSLVNGFDAEADGALIKEFEKSVSRKKELLSQVGEVPNYLTERLSNALIEISEEIKTKQANKQIYIKSTSAEQLLDTVLSEGVGLNNSQALHLAQQNLKKINEYTSTKERGVSL